MTENLSIPQAAMPRRGVVALIAGAVALLLAGTVALWAHYGTAIFFEMIRTGFASCFG